MLSLASIGVRWEAPPGWGGHDGHTQASSPTSRRRPTARADAGRAERGVAVAVPADRRVRVPVRLPHRLAGGARRCRSTGCAFPGSTRRACSARLLDREAGRFRFGPFGINVPTARRYETGTNVLVTTWKTPPGWVVVRDALTMGASTWARHRHAAHPTAHRRRRRAHAGPGRRVPRGTRRDGAGVRAGVRLRAGAGDVVDRRRGRVMSPRRPGGDVDDAAAHRPARRRRRRPGAGSSRARGRGPHLLRVVVGARTSPRRPMPMTPSARIDATVSVLAALAGRRPDPRSPLPRADPALGARHQGADLHADGRHGGGADDRAAGDARR